MSAKRYNRLHKATALVPLALLSAAWTVNVTGLTQSSANASGNSKLDDAFTLPDGTSVPSQEIDAPASVSSTVTDRGVGDKSAQNMIKTASTAGIPAAALAAYQRATTVINAADKTCHLDWPLIAAIGRVESNHGRANGNKLSADGHSTPGIFGPALNGKAGITRITDTDGGQYDGDTTFDRAIGPMQFIPSTWAMVGVDADGDGKRDPQDINDAALATAVYLCSGPDDLSADAGQRAAVFRYNHSQTYVATVLAIANAYRTGDFTAIPNNTVPIDSAIAPVPAEPVRPTHKHGKSGTQIKAGGAAQTPGESQQSSEGGSTSAPGSDDSGSSNPITGGGSTSGGSGADKATKSTTKTVTDTGNTVKTVLATPAQILAACTAALDKQFVNVTDNAISSCVDKMSGKTLDQVNATVAGVASTVGDVLGLVDGLGSILTGN